jgi:hypothetical protein
VRRYNPARAFLFRSWEHGLALGKKASCKALPFGKSFDFQRHRINSLHKCSESAIDAESPSGQRLLGSQSGGTSRAELSAQPPRDESHERGNTSGGRKKEQILPAYAVKKMRKHAESPPDWIV